MESTTVGESSMSVPVGNTTTIDPAKSAHVSGPVTPLPAARPEEEPRGARELTIKTLPDIDEDACSRTVTYPQEARDLGIEGDVKLRVAVDATGKVTDVKVLSGLGHGLDREAAEALKHKCKFTAAIASDGHPVPFVIEVYKFHFEIDR
jgi:protein TonB